MTDWVIAVLIGVGVGLLLGIKIAHDSNARQPVLGGIPARLFHYLGLRGLERDAALHHRGDRRGAVVPGAVRDGGRLPGVDGHLPAGLRRFRVGHGQPVGGALIPAGFKQHRRGSNRVSLPLFTDPRTRRKVTPRPNPSPLAPRLQGTGSH